MTGNEQREIGVLSAKLDALEEKFEQHRQDAKESRAETKADMKEIRASLQTVLDKLNGWQGGWKAMTIVASIAGTLGAAAVRYLPMFFNSKGG